nr:Nicastrin [Hymenolepis microstoma]
MQSIIYWIFVGLVIFFNSSSCRKVYDEISDKNLSHCSRKLNVTSEVGCSSKYPSSIGELIIEDDLNKLKESVQNASSDLMVVIPLGLFINRDLTEFLRNSDRVSGLLVFSPNFPNSTAFVSNFSENSHCPNGNFTFYSDSNRVCGNKLSWNPYASDYATTSWPFPVVLADGNDTETWNKIVKCHSVYNKMPIDDTRCLMEIANFMSAVLSSQKCYDRESLQNMHLSLTSSYCEEVGGVNLALRARNTTVPEVSRIDALSMFDRSASSAFSVLPAVSVIISAAAHLLNQVDVKSGNLRKNLLFVLLDNEALSFAGSQRFFFDLTHDRLARASGLPFKTDSIESIIELVGIGLPQTTAANGVPIYYLLSDPSVAQYFHKEEATSALWRTLNASANEVILLNGSSSVETTILPPSASLQAMLRFFIHREHPISHTIISDRPAGPPFADYFLDSFLDTQWPAQNASDDYLNRLANLLADALHRLIVEDASPISEPISRVKPGELMNCFLKDPGCGLLRLHLEPEVVDFLLSLRRPIPMQTYDAVDSRDWRVSHVASHLLMGLTGERLKECPPKEEYGAFTYMYGYYNGSWWCYRSLVEAGTSFLFSENGKVAAPGWVRSTPYQSRRFVRLFRSSSPSNDKVALVVGIFLTLTTAILATFGLRYSQQLFVRSCDLPQTRCGC